MRLEVRWRSKDLESEAFLIGANRKILSVLRRIRRLQQMQPSHLHAEIPSSPEETWQDWYDACQFLTLDVILEKSISLD